VPIIAVILAIASENPVRLRRSFLQIPEAAVSMVGVKMAIRPAMREQLRQGPGFRRQE
jgi:hypothetical protein